MKLQFILSSVYSVICSISFSAKAMLNIRCLLLLDCAKAPDSICRRLRRGIRQICDNLIRNGMGFHMEWRGILALHDTKVYDIIHIDV